MKIIQSIFYLIALVFFLAVLAVYWPSNLIFQLLTMAKDAAEKKLDEYEGV
jgi:CHASE3 domain sensor protein